MSSRASGMSRELDKTFALAAPYRAGTPSVPDGRGLKHLRLWFDFYFGDAILDSCPNPDDGVDYVSSLRFKLIYRPWPTASSNVSRTGSRGSAPTKRVLSHVICV